MRAGRARRGSGRLRGKRQRSRSPGRRRLDVKGLAQRRRGAGIAADRRGRTAERQGPIVDPLLRRDRPAGSAGSDQRSAPLSAQRRAEARGDRDGAESRAQPRRDPPPARGDSRGSGGNGAVASGRRAKTAGASRGDRARRSFAAGSRTRRSVTARRLTIARFLRIQRACRSAASCCVNSQNPLPDRSGDFAAVADLPG